MAATVTAEGPGTFLEDKSKKSSEDGGVMIYRFYGNQIVYPGQGGLNPCWFCKWIYRGRFTLQMGCLFIGCALVVPSYSRSRQIYAIILVVLGSTRIAATSKEPPMLPTTHRPEKDQETITLVYVSASLVIIGSALFLLVPGILLIIAAFKLHGKLCFIYSVLMTFGLCYSLIETLVASVLVASLDVRFSAMDFKLAVMLYVWAFESLDVLFRLYCLFCGYGLNVQIRSGEYDIPVPPFIASTYAMELSPSGPMEKATVGAAKNSA